MSLLKGSLFLKVAALVFAIVGYFYIRNEITRVQTQNKVSDPSYKLIKLTAKRLPVKLRLETSPPEGYQILENQVVVKPDYVVAIGPEALLDEAFSVETGILDVSESMRTVTKKIPLESVAGIHLGGEPYTIEATIPIEKTEIPE